MIRRALAVLGPLLLLALFGEAFLRLPFDAASTRVSTDCSGDGNAASDVALLEQCATIDPTNVGLLSDLGAAYASAGRPERAEAAYREALTLDPHDGDLHLRLGILLLRRRAADEALAEGERALREEPGRGAARSLVAEASAARAGAPGPAAATWGRRDGQ